MSGKQCGCLISRWRAWRSSCGQRRPEGWPAPWWWSCLMNLSSQSPPLQSCCPLDPPSWSRRSLEKGKERKKERERMRTAITCCDNPPSSHHHYHLSTTVCSATHLSFFMSSFSSNRNQSTFFWGCLSFNVTNPPHTHTHTSILSSLHLLLHGFLILLLSSLFKMWLEVSTK